MSTSETLVDPVVPSSLSVSSLRRGSLTGVVACTFVLVFEMLRTLYPLGYALVGDLGFVVTPLLLLVVFVSPVLAVCFGTVERRMAVLFVVSTLAGVRLALQLLAPPPLWAAVVAAVVALTAVTVVLGAALGASGGAAVVALGFVVGVGADAALKAAFAAWDRVWQRGVAPLAATSLVCAVTVWFAVKVWRGEELPGGEPRRGRVGRVFSITVLLMPTMMFVASIAFIGSQSGLGLSGAAVSTIGGSACAVVAARWALSAHIGRMGGAVAAVALGAVLWTVQASTGLVVAVLAVAGQCLVAVLLVAVLLDEPSDDLRRGFTRTAIGSTLGSCLMFVLTLLYPFHYEMPLPFTNRLLPVIAVAFVGLGLASRRDIGAPVGERDPIGKRVTWGLVLGLVLCAFGVAGFLSVSAHDPVRVVEARFPVVVATFNIDQAATSDGAVDFSGAATQIADLDADLVALQEVGRGWPLSGMNDFAAWLEHSTGLPSHFAPAADGQFGNLLVTRVALTSVRTIALPQGAGSMGRSAVLAVVPTEDDPLTLIAVHLQHRNSAGSIEARRAELQVVLDEWSGASRTVVMGDFNANNQPSDDGVKVLVGPNQANTLQPLLDAGFTTTQPTERCTLPTSNDNCSDFILVSPDLLESPAVQVWAAGPVGDHRAVVVAVQPIDQSGS